MSRATSKSSIPKFYQNRAVEKFAAKPSTPISLRHLVNIGRYGRNKGEKDEGEKLLKGGNFLRTELPTRLSHRLRDLQSLPFIVVSHPRLEHVYDMYLEAFERIRKYPVINTLEDNDRFCEFMQDTLDRHQVVIPELAIGMAESSPVVLSPQGLDTFMTRMLRSRISRRVITEQHIALTQQFRERQRKGKGTPDDEERRVGVVDTRLNAADVVRKCASLLNQRGGPEGTVLVVLEGQLDTTFAYIPGHLEYMLFELVKNAAHGTVAEHGAENVHLHPIVVTIVHGPKDLLVRVSDQGGGIPPWGGLPPRPDPLASDLLSSSPPLLSGLTSQRLDIFSFSHMRRLHLHHISAGGAALVGTEGSSESAITALRRMGKLTGTVEEQVGRTQVEGAGAKEQREATELMDAQMNSGIGLPLAKMFAEYFGGSLQMNTVRGEGSDAQLVVKKIGTPRDA